MPGERVVPTGKADPAATAKLDDLAGMSDLAGMLDEEMSRRVISPVLIGRATEMAALEAACDAVRQGGPATVLIGGEAGAGKTRLVSEFVKDKTALTGPCVELGSEGLPFGPFTAMLRELVRERGVQAVTNASGRAIRELARLLPELDGEEGQVADQAESRARLFEEFLGLLDGLASGDDPLVVVVEDAHWADRSSRDLLAFLIRYQRTLKNVLIIVTFRSDELHRTHPLRPLLAELERIDWVERINLPQLTRDEAGDMARAILGGAADGRMIDALYSRTEGNPLFTEELLACPMGGEIPDSLKDLLLNTIRQLPESTQEVLRIASAGSGPTSHALLSQVTGLDSASLIRALRPAVTANVLITSTEGYAFRHELIREAVHEDLLPGEHGMVHGKFAEAINAHPEMVPEGRAEIEKAHHWYIAHDAKWALISAWQAAAQASKAVAHAERLGMLARVLELWDQVPDAEARIGTSHSRVLEAAVASALDAGEDQRGLKFANAALKELDPASEPVRVALLLDLRQRLKFRLGLPGPFDDLDEALRLVPAEVSIAARMRILLSSARCGTSRQGPQYRAWAEEALRYARAEGDRATEAKALITIGMVEADPGALAAPDSEPLRMIAEGRKVAQQAGAYHQQSKAAISESHLLCGAGEYEAAIAVAREGIANASKYGLARTDGAFLAINVAEPMLFLGEWDKGFEAAERALDLAPPPLTRSALCICLGLIALGRGDLGKASRMLAAARDVLIGARYEDQYHLPLATLEIGVLLASRDVDGAAAAAMAALDRYDLPIATPRYSWPFVVAAVQARQASDALAERLRTLGEKLQVFGPVQRAYQLTFEASEAGADVAAWDRAAEAWDALHQPYETARALLAAAEAAASSVGKDSASQRLSRAFALATVPRAEPLTDSIMTLARRIGAPLGNASPEAHLGLTDREFEVLRLVAAGHTNREIAADLFISPKTASVHVSNILGKLSVATRGEAAAKAHELRLFDATY